MNKEIHCDCGTVISADTESRVIEAAQEHGRTVHGMDIPADAMAPRVVDAAS